MWVRDLYSLSDSLMAKNGHHNYYATGACHKHNTIVHVNFVFCSQNFYVRNFCVTILSSTRCISLIVQVKHKNFRHFAQNENKNLANYGII